MTRGTRRLVFALALGSVASCGLDTTAPVAGVLRVNLVTPNGGTDGAILFTVSGPAVLASATAGAGLRLFAQSLGTTNHFAVTGPLSSGTIVTIGVADVNRAGSYRATIQGVAATSFQLRALTGYSLSVVAK